MHQIVPKFWQTKIFAVYAPVTYFIIFGILGMLQHRFFKLFPKFHNYNNNKNTYKYIVFIMETYKQNIKGNPTKIIWKYYGSNLININRKHDNIMIMDKK